MNQLEDRYGFHLSESEERKYQRQADRLARIVPFVGIITAMVMTVLAVVANTVFFHDEVLALPIEALVTPMLILAILVLMCLYTWGRINRNIGKGQFFTHENASLISYFGRVTEVLGIILAVAEFGRVNTWLLSLMIALPLFLGCLFDLIGYLIRRGVQMQEERNDGKNA